MFFCNFVPDFGLLRRRFSPYYIYIEGLTGNKARAESALINIMSNVIYSIFY